MSHKNSKNIILHIKIEVVIKIKFVAQDGLESGC
jgi:hypothetical protein